MDDTPWLQDMIDDEELQTLFTEDEEELQRGVRFLIRRTLEDADLESRLVDLVDLALEHRNDATNASVWATVVLGEARSQLAIGTLERSLAADHDEVLQDAAMVALLRIGTPALEAVMDTVDDDASVILRRAAYGLLGLTAVLEDDLLTERVGEFLKSRIGLERSLDVSEQALEELFTALASLGRRDALDDMHATLREDRHSSQNPALLDALERLENNAEGTAFVGNISPWEERYGWLFGDLRDAARVRRDEDEEDFGDDPTGEWFLQGLGQRPDGGPY